MHYGRLKHDCEIERPVIKNWLITGVSSPAIWMRDDQIPEIQCWVRYFSNVFQILILIRSPKSILNTSKYYTQNASKYRYKADSIKTLDWECSYDSYETTNQGPDFQNILRWYTYVNLRYDVRYEQPWIKFRLCWFSKNVIIILS